MNWDKNMYLHNVIFLILDRKKTFFFFEILYCQEYSNKSKSTSLSTIDIVVDGDHG